MRRSKIRKTGKTKGVHEPNPDQPSSASATKPAKSLADLKLLFFASAFCDPCIHTRAVLDLVSKLVPALTIVELDVARDETESQRAGIRSTPTVVILGVDDVEAFRAEGVPSLDQVLAALAHAL